ncbi:hypothetical protein AOL_s00097g151 [Orbilia oligospora ATCC 24927]|uniref:Uncharacterized protein n=1 Tax=Arthrobotrys oligospora (strain ATCC 24927 / CBS 115.81 / DSM 1491) TaxID=756982 RepID=G1XIH4_ARTOA|nr:hypothetical protein AOL_s00097g151 [Orbilia oligospora ATCC 24927]EGX47105.1 hypothetical protein AOL_s00097g151 [Orbilia oligospora ATCC 24927]
MPQLESSVPNKASPLQGRETAVQPAAGSKISGSENNARIASGSKVLEHARKSQVTKCQEHVVVPVIKAPVGGVVSNSLHPAAFDLPPIQEHSIPMSIPEDEEKPVSGQSEPEATPPASPQPKAHRPHRERSLSPGDSPQNKSSASKKKQVTQEVPLKPIVDVAATSGAAPGTKPTQNPTGKPPRQKSKPFAEEPQVDEATEPSLVSKFKVQNRFLMDSVAANPGNTLMILKWLSGNYEPMDLDPEGSESESMTVQRLRFHHIETLEGIKAADWQHIQESGEVAYRLFHELLELEADSLRKGGSPNQVPYHDWPRDTRLIYEFWCIFKTIIELIKPKGEVRCRICAGASKLAVTHPGAALERVILSLTNVQIQVCNSDSEMAEDRCTKLFRYIGVLEQHEKVFSAQMKTVAHFLMASILRKKGHNVEARFYTAQVRRVKDTEEMVWIKWVKICLTEYLDLEV